MWNFCQILCKKFGKVFLTRNHFVNFCGTLGRVLATKLFLSVYVLATSEFMKLCKLNQLRDIKIHGYIHSDKLYFVQILLSLWTPSDVSEDRLINISVAYESGWYLGDFIFYGYKRKKNWSHFWQMNDRFGLGRLRPFIIV